MAVAKPQVESRRKVLLYPGEDGYFVVEVPSLHGKPPKIQAYGTQKRIAGLARFIQE